MNMKPKQLNEREKDKISLVGKAKFVRGMLRIYNTLCSHCRSRVLKNPRMKLKEYCWKCQQKVKPMLEELLK